MKDWNMANRPSGIKEDLYRQLMAHKCWLDSPDHPLAAQLSLYSQDLSGLDFNGFCMDKAIFDACNLGGSTFINCDMNHAMFLTCNLSGAQFGGMMHRAVFLTCNFAQADFMSVIGAPCALDVRYPLNFGSAEFKDDTIIELCQRGSLESLSSALEDDEIPF